MQNAPAPDGPWRWAAALPDNRTGWFSKAALRWIYPSTNSRKKSCGRPSRRCGRARSAFALSWSSPSTCTGKPTRSIASPGMGAGTPPPEISRKSALAADAPFTVVLRGSHDEQPRAAASLTPETSASASAWSRRCGRARSAFARWCNCPSTCTGRPTPSIASRGRISPRPCSTRLPRAPKSARRAGRCRTSSRTRRPGAGTGRRSPRTCRSATSSWPAPRPTVAGATCPCPGSRCSTKRPLPRLPRRRARHHRAQGRRGGAPRAPVVPGVDGPHQPRHARHPRPRTDGPGRAGCDHRHLLL